MSIQRISVKYPVSILMLFAGIILLGIISLDRLSIDLFPDISTPKIKIELLTTDKSPEEVEKKFTENIERQVSTINNLKRISSISTIGKAIVNLEFFWDTDMDFTLLDVQKKVGTISSQRDVQSVIVTKEDFQSLPIMTLAYYSDFSTDSDRLRKEVEEAVVKRLITLQGVAKGEIYGGLSKEIYIELDKYKLTAYQISDAEVIGKINSTNIDASGGRIEDNENVYIVKGLGKFQDIEDVKNLIITIKTKINLQGETERTPIYLRDLAKVYYRNAEAKNYSRYNRKDCIGINIYKESGSNTVKVSSLIKEELEKIKSDLPDSNIEIVNEQSEFINLSISNLRNSLLIGILLAVIIIFIFLRNFYTTIIISLAIPVSIIATFNLMYYFDLSLNLMTLGGLALGAGMLVDNAIIVIENIFRHREKGAALIDAVDKGTSEVGAAISSSTLTTIIV
ncbi:efflux RND transporter permease subunit, partial [candidate division KSB1 bacterium]